MGKTKQYFLIARNRDNNSFQVISVNGRRGCSLEEIDLYTTQFFDALDLEKKLQSDGVIPFSNVDFFIVSQNLNNGKTFINNIELLFSNNSIICGIAQDSLYGNIENSSGKIDMIIDDFISRYFSSSYLFRQVFDGRTNVYKKFVDYLKTCSGQSAYGIKYRDGGWARKSYSLIHNLLEAEVRNNDSVHLKDEMFRRLLDRKLISETSPDYDANQLSLFDSILDPEEEKEDKLLEVIMTFENLSSDTFRFDDERVIFNSSAFSDYASGELDILSTYLDEGLLVALYNYGRYKKYFGDGTLKFGESYQIPVVREQKNIINILNNSTILDRAFTWCMLYNKCMNRNKKIGDKDGCEYQKRKEESGA